MTQPDLQLPRPGMFATVRNRRAVVSAVEPFDGDAGRLHLVHLEYKDGQAPHDDRLLWEIEPHRRLLEPTALPPVGRSDPMPRADYDALLRAARWTATMPFLDPDGDGPLERLPISSPFHGAVQVEDFQLVPLLKALRMPRVNLLIADDVGLGKTVEAGLILSELLLRRRIQRVLILTPASLRLQWRDEMWEKFALPFDLVDRAETQQLRRRLGMDANPWRSFSRIIASYHYLRQPDVLEQFLAACHAPEGAPHLPWDLLIVDECHNLMPSPFGDDSDLCRMLRLLAPRFEHRVFLSATPHNGHTRSFTGLLEILDPVRFSQTDVLKPAERERVQQVVLRRLKREINERTDPPRFCHRNPPRGVELRFEPEETALSEAFGAFRAAITRLIRERDRRKRRAGNFAVEVLGKRLLSCPVTFAESWRRCREGIEVGRIAAEAEVEAARRELERETNDDRETQSREATAAGVVGAWLTQVADELADEIFAIDDAIARLYLGRPAGAGEILLPIADTRYDALTGLIDSLLRNGDDWRDDERLVVFTEYKTTLDYLTHRLRGQFDPERILTLYGGMDELRRDQVKQAFNDSGADVRVLVATDAAAEGLNLQRTARYLLHYDCPWNPSKLEQRNGRLDRHGQARDVTIRHFVSEQDADLRFLAHVLRKADEIREDLGSANELFDEAAQRRLIEGENAQIVEADLDRRITLAAHRSEIDADHTTDTIDHGSSAGQRLRALSDALDLSPASLRDTLESALAIGAGRPQLDCGPDATCRLLRPDLPSWSEIVDESLRARTGTSALGPVPRLAFSTEPFLEEVGGREIFRPRPDVLLMHLSHPLVQRALSSLTRRRFPGTGEDVSRWVVSRGAVPAGAEALVLLSVEEIAINELRETFHHWVRTIGFPVRDDQLGSPFDDGSPGSPLNRRSARDPEAADRAREIYGAVEAALKRSVGAHGGTLTQQLAAVIGEAGALARREEEERYRSRHGEVSSLIAENTIRKLEHEIARLRDEKQQGLLFDAESRLDEIDRSIDEKREEGALSPQVTALRTLVQPALWTPPVAASVSAPGTRPNPPLLQAILDSRKGQAELSAVLGERVREAVELLVQSHGEVLKERCSDVDPAEIYRAAVRIVMRLVVVLFAESRQLLPRENALYHGGYGAGGLLEELERIAARGGGRLARSYSAWPRLLSLFRLVHGGSHHPALPVPAYGGELFAAGDPAASDGLTRALSVFETACFERELMPDRDVHRILDRITRTPVRLRQGRSSTTVPAPVDFSDLSSEYIGILYEGLLDFELKTAPAGDPVVFLAVGNQPALPLSRLEAMDDRAIANLLEKMKDTSRAADDDEAGDETEMEGDADSELSEPDDDNDPDSPADEPDDEADSDGDDPLADDSRHTTRTRAESWARRAVEVGRLVRPPRGALTPERRLAHDGAIGRKARQLVTRVILPGEWYLVRWGGTRKGSGTFYTRPGLAVPTVHRTLRPLAFDPPPGPDGELDTMAAPARWTPKTPERILALKVCDPACGSGTFPVAALRFLTDALYTALHHHGRISREGDRAVVRLLEGTSPAGPVPEERLGHELLPATPESELFEPRLKAVLRRHVVERCIYGVDLDPLAVELCRLALWIETMDRSLPFSFLDHKIRVGNSLVGAWFDTFQHYPAMAWKNREGGDKGHSNGVHFEKDARGRAIKAFLRERLVPDLARFLAGRTLFDEDLLERASRVHDDALATLSRMHALGAHDAAERARIYREELLGSGAHGALKEAMDLWCACWFWPADRLSDAPLPSRFASPDPDTREIAREVAATKRFFHWELEFPDVFHALGSGFDAILGNPPWDVAKPNSKEFFSSIDPLYRSYGKQEALNHQTRYFEDAGTERRWLDYSADFRAQSNFVGNATSPFGDPARKAEGYDTFSAVRGKQNQTLHDAWRRSRRATAGFADPHHPFAHQGSADLNLYKLFLEQSHALLRDGGRLGFIVPSGLYSDHGTGALRKLFLENCRWEWLFGFENRDGIFEIHRSFKFNPIIVAKGGSTEAIQTAFMRRRLEDWERAEEIATPYGREQVQRFSPRSRAILEIQSRRDLEILEKIYANSVLLGDDGPDGWGIRYATEFHMTNDSRLFPPRPKWEAQGYRPDEYSRWLKGDWRPIGELWAELGVGPLPPGERRVAQPPYDTLPVPRADIPPGIILSREADAWVHEDRIEDTALPLMQGAMLQQFDFSQKGWVSGTGLQAKWRPITWNRKFVDPQFLMSASHGPPRALRTLHRRVARNTDSRTMIAALDPGNPAGDKAPVLTTDDPVADCLLVAILNSFVFDAVLRRRCGGTNIDLANLQMMPLPRLTSAHSHVTAAMAMGLSAASPIFSPAHLQVLAMTGPDLQQVLPWALTTHERVRRLAILNAIVAYNFGLDSGDLHHLLQQCDYPHALIASKSSGFDARGFWRVDKDVDPELRSTILTLVAFKDLESLAIQVGESNAIGAIVGADGGPGWQVPERLALRDYDLGHDDRAAMPQVVAAALGPRFLSWQVTQQYDEFARETHLHMRNILGSSGHQEGEVDSVHPGKTYRESRDAGQFDSSKPQLNLLE